MFYKSDVAIFYSFIVIYEQVNFIICNTPSRSILTKTNTSASQCWLPTNSTYSVAHNTSSIKIELRLYTYATCFRLLSGHRQAYQYKNLIKEDTLTSICLWRWNRQSVPKRRHIKSRRRVITQKKSYNIQNTAKAWN